MPKAKGIMKLFLIKTPRNVYATNANFENEALDKFNEEYPLYRVDAIKEIPVESLVRMEDNDSIIFFGK